jgi:RES domain-containing protein
VLVHADFDEVPSDLLAIEIVISAAVSIETLAGARLPGRWRAYPAPPSLARLGNAWLDRARAAVLRVPSALVPTESNFLLNPLHPDMKRVRVARKRSFRMDPRLTRR